jgi:hypothetical protein
VKNRNPVYFQSFFISVLVFISFAVSAQNTAVVFGKITDTDGAPVENVTISILGSPQAPVYSNEKGLFEYTVPSNTEITIVFSSINYNQFQEKLNLSNGQRKELNHAMIFKNNIGVVEITGDGRYQEITRIDPVNITHIPTASQDFNAILFTLPGVSSRNELSSSYSVRGGNFDENLVYVNGIEVYRPFLTRSGQQEGLSFINPDMVSSVVFSAGGFEAKYGDKMSSVLDVQYRQPRKFAGTASGSLLGSNLHLEGSSSNYRFTWTVGARYKTNKYLLSKTDTKAEYKPLFSDVQAYTTYDLNPNWQLDFLGNYASNRYQVVPQSRETDFGTFNQALRFRVYFDGQELDRFTTMLGALSANYRSDDEKATLKFIGSTFKSKESEAFDIQGQYFIDELESDFGKSNFGDVIGNKGVGTYLNHARTNLDATVYSAEHKGTYSVNRNMVTLWGVKYSHEEINDKLSEWKYVDSAGFSMPITNPQDIVLQDVIKQKINIASDRVSGYLQTNLTKEFNDTSFLSATIGVRASYWTLNKQPLVGPRATFGYKPHWKKDFLFKFSTGYYYQPPFYRELRDDQGNINYNLKAQTSIHFVLCSDYNFTSWRRPFKFIAEAYYKYLDNLVPYDIDNVRIRYSAKNNARGYARGIDLKVNGEFIKGLESWASVSLSQTKEDIKDDFYYSYVTDTNKVTSVVTKTDSTRVEPGYIPRPTDQLITFAIFFQDQIPNYPDFKVHLNLLYGSGIPFGPPGSPKYLQTHRMSPYRRVDIGFSYQPLKENREIKPKSPTRFLKSVWISLEVFNLLGINNTVSYLWVEDVSNRQWAIPNYLTSRQLNLRLIAKF